VIGSDVASTNHERPAGVVDCLQRSEDGVSAPSSEISAVLKSEPTRADLSDDADRFEEEARPRAFDAPALGVGADVLAGRASDDDSGESPKISQKSLCREGAHVIVDQDPRIVLGIEDAPPFDVLAGRDRGEARAVHAERPTARRRAEQVERF
jgi:hypothetical protein